MLTRSSCLSDGGLESVVWNGIGGVENLEAVIFEGFGPGGVAVIVEALTDNRRKITPVMRSLFSKFGGGMGDAGAVAYLFETKGILAYENVPSPDAVMELAIDLGAEDVDSNDNQVQIICEPNQFNSIRKALEEQGFIATSAQVEPLPSSYIEVANTTVKGQLLALLDALEDHEDVQSVFHNAQLD